MHAAPHVFARLVPVPLQTLVGRVLAVYTAESGATCVATKAWQGLLVGHLHDLGGVAARPQRAVSDSVIPRLRWLRAMVSLAFFWPPLLRRPRL